MNTQKDKHPHELLLLPRLLDCQIMDADGIRCGKVDDIAIEGKPGEKLTSTGILLGAGLWQKRKTGFFSRLFDFIIPSKKIVHIPWQRVKDLDPLITLNCTQKDIYISKFEKKLKTILSRVPGGI